VSSAASATTRLLQGDINGALSVLGSPDLRAVAGGSYTVAMHVTFWALAALMVLGAVAVGVLTGRPGPPASAVLAVPAVDGGEAAGGARALAGDRCAG
jgi:hypothetical protein